MKEVTHEIGYVYVMFMLCYALPCSLYREL